LELDLMGVLGGFSAPTWDGPALPRPEGADGLEEIFDSVDRLIARGQYLIQPKDGLSITYTLNNITATAERFMLGTEDQVQQAADLRGLLILIEEFLRRIFTSPAHANQIASAFERLRAKVEARLVARSAAHGAVSAIRGVSSIQRGAAHGLDGATDYSALRLRIPASLRWPGRLGDVFRRGFPHVTEYSAAITDPKEATRQFWPTLRSNALPYNLLVLQKLTPASAMSFRNNLGLAWLPTYDELLDEGRLYGIDMTIFSGLDPQRSRTARCGLHRAPWLCSKWTSRRT
jgi:hypothetical protein